MTTTYPRLIVHMVGDDEGREQHGRYGVNGTLPGLPATPFLDELYDHGMPLLQYHCESFCSPSRADQLTGSHTEDHTDGDIIEHDTDPALPEWTFTLPEMLKVHFGSDILTAALGKWHLGSTADGNLLAPNLAGFDFFYGSKRNLGSYYDDTLIRQGEEISSNGQYIPQLMASAAISWLRRLAGDPLKRRGYLYLPWHLPHEPFHRPPTNLFNTGTWNCPLQVPVSQTTSEIVPYFKAALEAGDRLKQMVWAAIPDSLKAETVLICSSDNGTAVVPATYEFTPGGAPADPTRFKRSPGDYGVHVGAYAYGPFVRSPGTPITGLVHAVDWFSTIADLFGITNWRDIVTKNLPKIGRTAVDRSMSIAPNILNGTSTTTRNYAFGRIFSPNGANNGATSGRGYISDSRWKLWFEGVAKVQPIFYDLQLDPYEHAPITKPGAQAAAALGKLQQAWADFYASLPALPT